MANVKKKQTRDERLEKKRQAEKLRYQRIKNDPVKNAELKEKEKQQYKKKKEKEQIKSINDMTKREQRAVRKIWREKTKKHRDRVKLQSTRNYPVTPPASNNEDQPPLPQNNIALAAKRRSEIQRKLRNNQLGHDYHKKNLISVNKNILRHNANLHEGDKLYNECRKATLKLPDILTQYEGWYTDSSESQDALNISKVPLTPEKIEAIDTLHKSLTALQETPIKRKRLTVKYYPETKIKKVPEAFRTKMLNLTPVLLNLTL
ncbi:hypothetical protein FQA39_LY06450 [Lamprigera yunnana]|nr:hypothetical protein FQA39_LY06450 [Lamprigera yunnana]